MTRPDLTGRPVALFVFSNLREQKFGLTKAWLRRLRLFAAAGWDTHVATIHLQPEIDETLAAWVERGWLPASTEVHHFQRRNKRFRPSWHRRTDDAFSRDDRIADWLDWLVGRIPGAVVFADSPVTYAPVAKMRNPHVGRIMTLHLVHRGGPGAPKRAGVDGSATDRRGLMASRYGSADGQPKLAARFLPFAAQADVVVALTQGHALDLREDLPGVDVRVLPNIVDPPDLPTGLLRDDLRVVYLGRLDRIKRVDHAIRAVGRAAETLPGVHMDIFGRGPDLDRLVALRDSLGLRGVVEFRGFTGAPDQELARSALSTMTARREPFGLSVAESLAVGTPVVTYEVDYGPRELVTDAVNGRVVRDGSVAELARAIVEVLGDRETWSRMSAAAPAAIDRLHPDLVGRAWIDLAGEVAARVTVPGGEMLIEDLRVRREGVVATGVVIAADEAHAPRRLVVDGSTDPGTALEWATGTGADRAVGTGGALDRAVGTDAALDRAVGGGRLVVADAEALLPRGLLAAWPVGGRRVAGGDDGDQRDLRSPGVPRTVVPTDRCPVVLEVEDSGSLVRAADPGTLMLEASPEGIHGSIDDEDTVLTEALDISGRLVGHQSMPAEVELMVNDPGLGIADGSRLPVVARTPEGVVALGTVEVLADAHRWVDRTWRGRGELSWDLGSLARAAEAIRGPVTLSLGCGTAPRAIGPLTFGAPRPLTLLAGERWALGPGRARRLLLVPGGARRARASFWLRHFHRKGSSV